jgi:hypothetical protein
MQNTGWQFFFASQLQHSSLCAKIVKPRLPEGFDPGLVLEAFFLFSAVF